MSLLSVFYSEFDNAKGPLIRRQYPPNVINSHFFGSVSEYVITRPILVQTPIHIKVNASLYTNLNPDIPLDSSISSLWLFGFPIHLVHERYGRNALMLNLGCMFGSSESNPMTFDLIRIITSSLRTIGSEIAIREYSMFLTNIASIPRPLTYFPFDLLEIRINNFKSSLFSHSNSNSINSDTKHARFLDFPIYFPSDNTSLSTINKQSTDSQPTHFSRLIKHFDGSQSTHYLSGILGQDLYNSLIDQFKDSIFIVRKYSSVQTIKDLITKNKNLSESWFSLS